MRQRDGTEKVCPQCDGRRVIPIVDGAKACPTCHGWAYVPPPMSKEETDRALEQIAAEIAQVKP